jgi:hypothetical protein
MAAADATRPRALDRKNRPFHPGIGPHTEPETIALAIANEPALHGARMEEPYPAAPNRHCDLVIDDWGIEVKNLRVMRDNNTKEPFAVASILSPYPDDSSAITDCLKLIDSGFELTAILIFGFDYALYPMAPIILAFEAVASRLVPVPLTPCTPADTGPVIHYVYSVGRVHAWELGRRTPE